MTFWNLLAVTTSLEQSTYAQSADHFDTRSESTFAQRYSIDKQFFHAGNDYNVVLVDPGCFGPTCVDESIDSLAYSLNAVILRIQPRFTGESIPVGGDKRLLTMSQILADIASFVTDVVPNVCKEDRESNKTCKVGVVGTGLRGTIATYFRQEYPHLSEFSYALSAPLSNVINFSSLDSRMYDLFSQFGSDSCTKQIMRYLSEIYAKPNEFRDKIGVPKTMSDKSFFHAINDVLLEIAVKGTESIKETCTKWDLSSINGFISSLSNYSVPISKRDPFNPSDVETDSFWYLTCNELGLFPTSDGFFRSEQLDVAFYNSLCQEKYGLDQINTPYYFSGKCNKAVGAFFSLSAQSPYFDALADETCIFQKTTNNIDIDNYLKVRSSNECGPYGELVLGQCVCDSDHQGLLCDLGVHSSQAFKIVTVLSVVVPTVLLLILGGAVWLCGRREDSDFGSRPSLYT